MTYSPLAIKRRNVLGDLYNRCETSEENIPVYLADKDAEPIGHVDEGLGHYADAFLFHLPEDICKKLSTSHYNYGLDYELCSEKPGRRIKLTSIILVAKVNALISRDIANSYSNPKR